MRWSLAVVVLVACACPSKPSTVPATGSGSGSGTGPVGSCDQARARIEQLYRAEAQAKEPARVDEAVADNTAMVMNDCAKDPPRVSACVATAQTAAELEARCLAPLDDEGSEGDALAR